MAQIIAGKRAVAEVVEVLTRDFLLNADCKRRLALLRNRFFGQQSSAQPLWRRPWPVVGRWLGVDLWLRFADVESGAGVSRVLYRYATGLAPRVCLRLTAGRGSATQPGRMLALKEGGHHRRCLPPA